MPTAVYGKNSENELQIYACLYGFISRCKNIYKEIESFN